MKPIQTAFKAAQAVVCLANEWRDTISYTLFTAYAAYQLSQGYDAHFISIASIIVACREVVRGTAWGLSGHSLRLAGDSSKPVNASKNKYAAGTVAMAACVASVAFSPHPYSLVIQLSAIAFNYAGLRREGARIRDIPELYFHEQTGMWDWPRKKGGGPTQTDKLKKAISDFGKSLTRPVFGAARIVQPRRQAVLVPQ